MSSCSPGPRNPDLRPRLSPKMPGFISALGLTLSPLQLRKEATEAHMPDHRPPPSLPASSDALAPDPRQPALLTPASPPPPWPLPSCPEEGRLSVWICGPELSLLSQPPAPAHSSAHGPTSCRALIRALIPSCRLHPHHLITSPKPSSQVLGLPHKDLGTT